MRKRRMIRLYCMFFIIMLLSLPKISIAETNVISTIETSFSNSPNEKLFIDVPEDAWYVKNLEKNIEIGLLSGYSDGTFDPQHNIHWWTLAQVLYNLTEGYPLTWWEDESIRDTSTQQMWYQSVMNFAMDYGLIPNSSEKKYAVEWPTRFQIIQSFYQLAIRTEAIEITQTRAMDWIQDYNILIGDENGDLHLEDRMTRAELSEVLQRVWPFFKKHRFMSSVATC